MKFVAELIVQVKYVRLIYQKGFLNREENDLLFISRISKMFVIQFNLQNLIVEGCYTPLDWQKDFDNEYLESIKYYCLVMSEGYIRNHFVDIKKYANVIIKHQVHRNIFLLHLISFEMCFWTIIIFSHPRCIRYCCLQR